jgi:hypothetical protein
MPAAPRSSSKIVQVKVSKTDRRFDGRGGEDAVEPAISRASTSWQAAGGPCLAHAALSISKSPHLVALAQRRPACRDRDRSRGVPDPIGGARRILEAAPQVRARGGESRSDGFTAYVSPRSVDQVTRLFLMLECAGLPCANRSSPQTLTLTGMVACANWLPFFALMSSVTAS